MGDNNSKNRDPNHRVCNRIKVNRKLLFERDTGEILEGRSVDISPRGVLMRTNTRPAGDLLGVAGTLFILSDEGHFSIGYPCKVVRLKSGTIALEIHKKAAAAFGHHMTKDLLGRG